jgi:hypothetical protein
MPREVLLNVVMFPQKYSQLCVWRFMYLWALLRFGNTLKAHDGLKWPSLMRTLQLNIEAPSILTPGVNHV